MSQNNPETSSQPRSELETNSKDHRIELNREDLLRMLDEMIVQQREKCLKIAHRINPRLTPDDLMNPFDWPEVSENPQFIWEDGLLAGLQATHAAICARYKAQDEHYEVKRLKTEGEERTS